MRIGGEGVVGVGLWVQRSWGQRSGVMGVNKAEVTWGSRVNRLKDKDYKEENKD